MRRILALGPSTSRNASEKTWKKGGVSLVGLNGSELLRNDTVRTKNYSRKEVDDLTTVLDHFRIKITLFTYHSMRRKRR